MASETMVETTIKLPESSEAQIGDLVKHRMIVTNGETLGDPAVGPTVLEMSCSTENATEHGSDRQKYESRQKEHREKEEDGAVVKHRDYEETAERARVQNTDDTEVSSQSTIKFEEQEKVREKDGTSKVAEYNARCEERHETTVSTVEKIGDRQFTRRRSSSKNLTRTCKRIEDMEDTAMTNGDSNTETSECNESSESSGFEKGATDDVLVKRSEKTTKSERSSTTISGGGDPSVFDKYEELLSSSKKQKGALIDLGALGEIKLSTKVSSGENTLEKDFQKSDYFNPDLAGLDFNSSSGKEGEGMEMTNGDKVDEGMKSVNKDFVSQVKEHAQERTAASRQKYSSSSSSLQEQESSSKSIQSSSHSSSQSSSQRLESAEASKTRRERVSMAEQNGHAEAHVGGEEAEAEDEAHSLPPSFNRRRYHESDADEDDYRSLPPPFAPKNRAETDDLIKRILAEAKGIISSPDKGGSSSPGKGDSVSPAKGESPAKRGSTSPLRGSTSPLRGSISPAKGERSPAKMNGTDSDSVPSPTSLQPPTTPPGSTKIKINMGGAKNLAETSNASSVSEATTAEEKSSMKKESMSMKSESMSMRSESTNMKSESMGMDSESLQSASSKAVGAERKRATAEDEEMSLFERRLAKGVGKKLANIFAGDEDVEGRNSMESDLSRSSRASDRSKGGQAAMDQSSSYSRLEQSSAASAYSSKSSEFDDQSKLYSRKSGREESNDFQNSYARKSGLDEQNDILNKYSRNEKDEFDELDDEINAWRKNFREQQARKTRAYMEEAEADETESALSHYHGGRGRLVRQGYMEAEDDDDAFAVAPRRPQSDFIPDEDFKPMRRAETTEIVTERTQEIRTVVDKQNTVLEKLRRASNSFDELTSEIKNLKAQVIENTARRSYLMDDGFDDEDDMPVAPPPPRAGRFSRYPSGSKSFDFSTYTPGSYSAYRYNRLNEMDREFADNVTSGDSLGLARYKKSYTQDDDFSFSSSKTNMKAITSGSSVSSASSSSSRFATRGLGRFGRSKSLYDELDDQVSDGDEFEEYKPRARPVLPPDDDQQPYTASVGPGYGSGHGSGDPDLGRSTQRSRFSSADDSATTSSSSNRLSYTSRFTSAASSGSSGSGGGYRSRLSRANTLSDFDFDRPSSKYDKYSSSSSGFTSRFLQKVRDKKKEGGAPEEGATASASVVSDEAPKRTKPFKSRFLRASFDSSDFTSKSSSYSSRFKGNSDSSFSSSASKPSEPSEASNDTAAPAASEKTEE